MHLTRTSSSIYLFLFFIAIAIGGIGVPLLGWKILLFLILLLAAIYLWVKPGALVATTVFLLAFSFIPYEIIKSPIDISYLQLVLCVALLFKYKLYKERLKQIEITLAMLLCWIIVRSLFDNNGVDHLLFLKDALKVISCFIVYRIGKSYKDINLINKALLVSFLTTCALIFYQRVIGLNHLLSVGYSDTLFNFHTEAGTYRPFGAFYSPTVLGCYMVTSGIYLGLWLWKNENVKLVWKYLFWAVFITALMIIETRASWLITIIILALNFKFRFKKIHLILTIFGLILMTLLLPFIDLSQYTNRFMTIFNMKFDSNFDRLMFWSATLQAAKSAWFAGYGSQDFASTISPYLPAFVPRYGHPHNTYLEILYNYGCVGLVIYLGILYKGFMESRYNKIIIFSILAFLINSFIEQVWFSFNLMLLLFLIFGLGVNKVMVKNAH